MNTCAVFTVSMTAAYKVIGQQGFGFIEFSLFRNITALLVCLVWCIWQGINPLKHFPYERRYEFFWRCLTGHLYFIFMNIAAPLAPLSIVMVFAQTSPFWISIIAYFFLNESIIPLEIFGMIVCFTAVVVIAITAEEKEINLNTDDLM